MGRSDSVTCVRNPKELHTLALVIPLVGPCLGELILNVKKSFMGNTFIAPLNTKRCRPGNIFGLTQGVNDIGWHLFGAGPPCPVPRWFHLAFTTAEGLPLRGWGAQQHWEVGERGPPFGLLTDLGAGGEWSFGWYLVMLGEQRAYMYRHSAACKVESFQTHVRGHAGWCSLDYFYFFPAFSRVIIIILC